MTLTRLMPTPPSTSAQRNASRPLRVRTSDSHTALSCRMFQPCTPSRPFPTVDAGFPSGYLRKCRVFPCFTTSSGASPPPMKKKTHHASFFFFLTARKARGNDFFKSGQNADAAILYLEAARYLPARVTEELPDSKDLLGSLHSNTAAAQATLFYSVFLFCFFFGGGGGGGGGGAVRKIRIRPPHRHCFPCDPVLLIHLWRGFPPFDGASRTGTRLC